MDGVIYVDSSSEEEEEGGEGAAPAPAAPQAQPQQVKQQSGPALKPSTAGQVPSRPSWRPVKVRQEPQPQQSAAASLEGPPPVPRELRRLQRGKSGAQQGSRLTRQGSRQQQQAEGSAAGLEDSSELEDAPLPSPSEQRAPAVPALSEEEEAAVMEQEIRDVRRCYLLPGHTWKQGGDVAGPPPRSQGSLVVSAAGGLRRCPVCSLLAWHSCLQAEQSFCCKASCGGARFGTRQQRKESVFHRTEGSA